METVDGITCLTVLVDAGNQRPFNSVLRYEYLAIWCCNRATQSSVVVQSDKN